MRRKRNDVPPELRGGMVVYHAVEGWVLMIDDHQGYRLKDEEGRSISLDTPVDLEGRMDFVQKIYWDENINVWPPYPHELRYCMRGYDDSLLYWERPPKVEELTVEEIEERLGHKVKIIGGKK